MIYQAEACRLYAPMRGGLSEKARLDAFGQVFSIRERRG
jgi:hypothetical protein